MPKIISLHSFRRGTGKSNLVASLAALLAAEGQRVGAIDTDLQSPSLHILFGLGEGDIGHSLSLSICVRQISRRETLAQRIRIERTLWLLQL